MAAFQSPEDVLQSEKRMVRDMVRREFNGQQFDNAEVNREMHNDSPEVSHVYGGAMSSSPQELQLVQAWRQTPSGQWQLGTGVIHRVHSEDRSVTVQFLPDQHRARLSFMHVKPVLDITPEYPTVRLGPGERLPTRSEILAREQHANEMRQQQGIPLDVPLPGTEHNLRAGESMSKDGTVSMLMDTWGIPAPTLDALRNRSIPGCQVGGEYGRHYYTNLYRNNFYLGKDRLVSSSGHVGVDDNKPRHDTPHYASHRYIPLDGPELEQDMRTGKWYTANQTEGEDAEVEGDSPFPKWMWFLG